MNAHTRDQVRICGDQDNAGLDKSQVQVKKGPSSSPIR